MKSSIILVKVINQVETELKRNEFKFGLIDKNNLGIYTFKIKYNFEHISIEARKEPILDWIKLIEVENQDISRGSVGLAKKGRPGVKIS